MSSGNGYAFWRLLRAEWTKFRSVRGRLIGTAVAAPMIVPFAVPTGAMLIANVARIARSLSYPPLSGSTQPGHDRSVQQEPTQHGTADVEGPERDAADCPVHSEQPAAAPTTRPTATYIGTATVLYELRRSSDSLNLLTDPVFDPPGTSHAVSRLPGLRYRSRRRPALTPDDMPRIDAVLLSHDGHADIFDRAGLAGARGAGRLVTTPSAARRLAGKGLTHLAGLAPWQVTEFGSGQLRLRVTATPARHGPPLSRPFAGAVTGFLLEWTDQAGGPLWISGDTTWHRALAPLASRGIGIAVVHCGGSSLPLTAGLQYTMDGSGVARMARTVRPGTDRNANSPRTGGAVSARWW